MKNELCGVVFGFVLFLFLNGVAGATNKDGFTIGSKSDYETMRPDLSNSNIVKAVTYYVADNKDESAFQTCIGAYVCGSDPIRRFLEKKLAGIGDVLTISKSVIAGK
ncbi:hypothetical protein FACS1894152_4640 [Bacilli bacterium]|nr:hypothetical protein FACS1894152_4640 [Bacilli bacterium]